MTGIGNDTPSSSVPPAPNGIPNLEKVQDALQQIGSDRRCKPEPGHSRRQWFRIYLVVAGISASAQLWGGEIGPNRRSGLLYLYCR